MRQPAPTARLPRGAILGLGLIGLGIVLFFVLPGTAIGQRAAIQPPPSAVSLPQALTPSPQDGMGGGGPVSTPTPIPAQDRPYASLYTRVDYPLQVAANSTSRVTLTLSTRNNLLTAAPAPGTGAAGVGAAAFMLPTDLTDYQDIQAQAEVTGSGQGPLLWQLASPERQSLLSSQADAVSTGQPVHYVDVTFRWNVRAMGAGQNTQSIKVSIFYIYGGVEHPGSLQVSDAPLPIAVVQPTPQNTFLPWLRIPASALLSLAGLLGLLQSLWTKATHAAASVNSNIAPLVALIGNFKTVTGLAKGAGQQSGKVIQGVKSIAHQAAPAAAQAAEQVSVTTDSSAPNTPAPPDASAADPPAGGG